MAIPSYIQQIPNKPKNYLNIGTIGTSGNIENPNSISSILNAPTKKVIAPTTQQVKASNMTIAPKGEVNNFKQQASAVSKQLTTPPAGSVAIPGAQYNTRELQQANFTNIQPIGGTLYGTPISQQNAGNPLGMQGPTPTPTTTPMPTATPTPPVIPNLQNVSPIGSVNTLQSQLADIQKQIADRQTATEQGDINLMAGQNALEGQGRAIPLSLIRGQQGKLETQGALDKMTKQTELAGLQRQEAGLISQLNAKISQSTPMNAGEDVIRFNPDTGQYETVYKGAVTPEKVTGMNVGAGETIINPQTGEVIYQAPAAGLTSADQLDLQKKQLEIYKLQEDINNSTSELDRALKQAELDTKLKALTGTQETSEYQVERAKRTVSNVDNIISKVNGWTTGWGSWLANIPSTDSANFAAELNTLKSNIAFGELTAMREASKTGGALGQVSDREGKLLESALGALDSKQSPANFRKNLEQIKASILAWQEAIGQGETSTGEFSW